MFILEIWRWISEKMFRSILIFTLEHADGVSPSVKLKNDLVIVCPTMSFAQARAENLFYRDGLMILTDLFLLNRDSCGLPGLGCQAFSCQLRAHAWLKRLQQTIIYSGGKFLKKLWCCVGGEYYKILWFYQLS